METPRAQCGERRALGVINWLAQHAAGSGARFNPSFVVCRGDFYSRTGLICLRGGATSFNATARAPPEAKGHPTLVTLSASCDICMETSRACRCSTPRGVRASPSTRPGKPTRTEKCASRHPTTSPSRAPWTRHNGAEAFARKRRRVPAYYLYDGEGTEQFRVGSGLARSGPLERVFSAHRVEAALNGRASARKF